MIVQGQVGRRWHGRVIITVQRSVFDDDTVVLLVTIPDGVQQLHQLQWRLDFVKAACRIIVNRGRLMTIHVDAMGFFLVVTLIVATGLDKVIVESLLVGTQNGRGQIGGRNGPRGIVKGSVVRIRRRQRRRPGGIEGGGRWHWRLPTRGGMGSSATEAATAALRQSPFGRDEDHQGPQNQTTSATRLERTRRRTTVSHDPFFVSHTPWICSGWSSYNKNNKDEDDDDK